MTASDEQRLTVGPTTDVVLVPEPAEVVDVDAGGGMVAHVHIEGARVGRIDISIRRALTSLAFDIETQDAATHFRAQADCFGIHASSDGHITIFAG